jgi:hypothetical protein
LHLRQYGRSWDTSVTVTLKYYDGGRTAVRAVLQDKLGVHVGDTISMPLYLLTSLTTGTDLRLTFGYNTDMLQILDPSFEGTSMSPGGFYDLKERPGVATLDFPGAVRFSSSLPFVVLRFRVLLTDTTASAAALRSLVLGSNAATNCIALESPSALVTESLECSQRPIYQYLRSDPIGPLRVRQSHGALSVSLDRIMTDGTISLYDALGRLVEESTLSATPSMSVVTLSVERSGFYTVVLQTGPITRTSRVIVER